MTLETAEPLVLKSLTRRQRRVLGTLIEKGLTTPDQYPLTVKGTVSGCNQKNNRDPVSNYDEDTVTQTLDELRELGLVAEVQTEGGRAPRYRHYVRQRLQLPEPQLAVLTELLLRGKQQPGELRTRASRLHPIDSQEQLRAALEGLMERGFVVANGGLERRGVEVDHNLYAPGENHERLATLTDTAEPVSGGAPAVEQSAPRPSAPAMSTAQPAATGSSGDRQLVAISEQVAELRRLVVQLQGQLSDVSAELAQLKQQLGV